MIIIPDSYKEKVINRYKDEGEKFLNSVNEIIEKYIKKFKLKNVTVLNNLSMNIILEATSNKYGKVIIKIGTPGITFLNEIKYINLLKFKDMVKCYYYNENDRIMILEKICPGYSLNEIESLDERVEIFCNILNQICENSESLELFPTYSEKLKVKMNEVEDGTCSNDEMRKLLSIATKMYNEICNMNLPKCVLHNDLHSQNILKSHNGWKFIDPHGIVGEKMFETCQFIKCEMGNDLNDMEKLNVITDKISKKIDVDTKLICKALYIENVTKLLFYIRSGDNKEKIINNIEFCKNLLKFC